MQELKKIPNFSLKQPKSDYVFNKYNIFQIFGKTIYNEHSINPFFDIFNLKILPYLTYVFYSL